jgi:hypothetical protein
VHWQCLVWHAVVLLSVQRALLHPPIRSSACLGLFSLHTQGTMRADLNKPNSGGSLLAP